MIPSFKSFLICFSIICIFLSICNPAYPYELTLIWDPNSESDLAGYKVYYGTESGKYGQVLDIGKYESVTISGFELSKTYFFAVTAYDLDGNESDFSDEISFRKAGDTIPLPSDTAYGNIISGDQSHIDEVNYSFAELSGDVILYYEAWDVDFTDEVEIILNGTHIGYAPVTGEESWGGLQAITLPDALVNDSSDNYLTFNNTSNPSNTFLWGVRYVSVEAPQL